MRIEHDLLPKQRKQKGNSNIRVDLYHYSKELYKELELNGNINRIKEIPQLGPIRVKRQLSKSRYDYVVLQLYLHRIVGRTLASELQYSYTNEVNYKDFMEDTEALDDKDRPTIGDLLQLLTIVYNIGHFYNTFTSSRAVIMYSNENKKFADMLIKSSDDQRFQEAAKRYIEKRNYHRLHLLNSILLLEMCNQELASVKIGKEILYSYIGKENSDEETKISYIFEVFKKVRSVSYIAYDLQISNTPLIIDLCDKNGLIVILKELLSSYNDQKPIEKLFKSTGKLLDDTIYNEKSNSICYYQISKKMVRELDMNNKLNCYKTLLQDPNSILNKKYSRIKGYDEYEILKLTFKSEEKSIAQNLLYELDHTNNIRVGYYDRYSGDMTILVAMKKNCLNKNKIAFKVLRIVIKYLRSIENHLTYDIRFLLTTKFFLYYFLGEKRIHLEPTVDDQICVLCTRGKTKRIGEVEKILKKGIGDKDQRHEAKFIITCLSEDEKNDVSITIPSSIEVLEKEEKIKKICEFDGMIINPNRETDQVILLEAKNTKRNSNYGKKCLGEKLDKLSFIYNMDDIKVIEHNAMLKVTI